ncbi:hypothetical protein DACRYDRAFT_22022 [Dacryopinax primogenitus]|uniref:Uncharacterized protein n=1 Tax=Dacryopinax primogenitus (strain DJM 731) TaxID=1858805 RepID=M5GDF6_DACPD|nr:uncharacterized protein DACRYDRAFT_22022 [Dacryopinax primogenitus]EJU02348.1 hypothetical protein DACRYDRAFT_22022 [Dacryopinax primogenitus]
MYRPSRHLTVEDISFPALTIDVNAKYINTMRSASPTSPYYTPPASPKAAKKPATPSGDRLYDLIMNAPEDLIAPSGSTVRIHPAGPDEAFVAVHPRFNRTCIDIDFCPAWPDARRITARVMRDDWEQRRCTAEDTRRAALKAYERFKTGLGWQVWEIVLPSELPPDEDSDPSDDDSGESTISWFSSESDSSV